MTTQHLWQEFNSLPKNKQIEILKQYTYYINDFEYGEENIPVCFLEWWTNDYLEQCVHSFEDEVCKICGKVE